MSEQTTLKTDATNYEGQRTGNIADLEKVSTSLPTETHEGEKDGKKFKYKTVKVDGQNYRVPWTVLSDLKSILEDNPDLEYFRVKKRGEGLDTRYTVIPLS